MGALDFETLTYGVEDGVATIALNRPEKLNAFNALMADELAAAFSATDADDAVRSIIVTGNGRVFCSGGELSNATGFGSAGALERDKAGLVTLRIFESLKPVVAAVNGPSVGVGVTMLLPMDVRLASSTARFSLPFSRRGIVMEGCSTFFLPRLVGMANALDWSYSGRTFSADEALEKGLVSSITEPDDLMPAARKLAREYAESGAPVSVSLTRQMCWRMQGAGHPMEAHIAESRALQARLGAADVKEGVAAFFEKRTAAFKCGVPKDLPDIWPDWVAPQFRSHGA